MLNCNYCNSNLKPNPLLDWPEDTAIDFHFVEQATFISMNKGSQSDPFRDPFTAAQNDVDCKTFHHAKCLLPTGDFCTCNRQCEFAIQWEGLNRN